MTELKVDHSAPSSVDGDGVRITEQRRRIPPLFWLLPLILVGAGLFWSIQRGPVAPTRPPAPQGAVAPVTPAEPVQQALRSIPAETTMKAVPTTPPSAPSSSPADWRTGDANDIATYVSATDPEPTAAELIKALRDSGDHGGIAAFNPPGTSPPLVGLAVPDDFQLPPGYVRHHQVTDAGEPLEAILMFSPDYSFRDANGQPLTIPEDRVVPPEMAPPGLPLRHIDIPPPPQ